MLSVVLTGIKEFENTLVELEKVTNTQDMLDQAGAYILFRIRERYLATEDPSGNQWPESQAARRRAASGRDGRTGFDTGTLFNSISLGRSGLDRVVFTDVEYARDFQEGPPERIFMETNFEDELGVQNILEDRIREVLQ